MIIRKRDGGAVPFWFAGVFNDQAVENMWKRLKFMGNISDRRKSDNYFAPQAQNIKLVKPDKTFGFVLHRLAGSEGKTTAVVCAHRRRPQAAKSFASGAPQGCE